jgi:hypothetical protein
MLILTSRESLATTVLPRRYASPFNSNFASDLQRLPHTYAPSLCGSRVSDEAAVKLPIFFSLCISQAYSTRRYTSPQLQLPVAMLLHNSL